MTLAQPPSFAQPNYYMAQNGGYFQGNPPPYTEYAQELAYIGSQRGHTNDGYWNQTRDDALRLLGDPAGPYVLILGLPSIAHFFYQIVFLSGTS